MPVCVPVLPTGPRRPAQDRLHDLPRSHQIRRQELPGCGRLASPCQSPALPILGQPPQGPDERPYE